MAQIQSNIGLATGINIGAIVQSMVAINQEQVTQLQQQNTTLTTKSTDLTELTALLTSLQGVTNGLGQSSLYTSNDATSSDPTALGVTVTGTVATGSYEFTPVQAAQSQELLSSGFASTTNPIGAGTISFRQGANLAQSMSLADLNGGQGVPAGEIKITDHSGASATIDLSTCQTVGDVLAAINNNSNISVSAVATDSGIELIDNSGGKGTLQVQDVGGGTTAEALGLGGINTSNTTVTGQPIISLSDNLNLTALNDGNGLRLNTSLPDISYTLHDGTTGTIDLSPIIAGTSTVQTETTLGQVLNEINAANPGLTVSIAANGTSLQATDSTSGSSAFTLTSMPGSDAVQDLGLTGTENNGVISGSRIIAGAQGVLLSQLNGGAGLGTLGTLNLTDRAGNSASVDLSQATTINDVINDINSATTSSGTKLGITAELDSSNLGIELVDTTGKTTSSLIVANGDSTDTATKLQITMNDSGTTGSPTNANATSVDSGNLHQRIISDNTLLSSLNGGAGVAQGTFTIVDSAGNRATINLASSSIQTVGDLLTAIDRSAAQVVATIDPTGDGIEIQDNAGGTGALQVQEGNSTTAADLHLLGTPASKTLIDGSSTYNLTVSATDTLSTVESNINALNAGVQAGILSDGSSNPYRLSLTSGQSGVAGSWNFASTGLNLNLQQISAGQDAKLLVGQSSDGASSLLVSSSTGQFTNVLPGATLQVNQGTGQPVAVSVTNSDASLASSINNMVTDYNQFQQQLTSLTAFDTTTDTGSALTGDYTALSMGDELGSLLSGSFGGGAIQSLAQIGVTMNSDGTLTFDQSVLDSAYSSNPSAVQQFFTNTTSGLSTQFKTLLTQLAGSSDSLSSNELQGMQSTITSNTTDITRLNNELTDQENQLYTQFYNMEVAVAQMQANLGILEAMGLATSSSSNNSSSSTTSSSSSSTSST